MTVRIGKRAARNLVLASLMLAGCPGLSEGVGGADETDSRGSTTEDSAPPSTTVPSTTVASMSESSTDSTMGSSSTPTETTMTMTMTTTGPTTGPTTSSTTDETETTQSEDDSSTSEDPPSPEGYGDCVSFGEREVCLEDEDCLQAFGFGVCGGSCAGVEECADLVLPGGDAPVACENVDDSGPSECILDCSSGQTCPTGMECFANDLCMWPDPATECVDRQAFGVPTAVVDTTEGAEDDLTPSCSAGNDEDYVTAFQAPAEGTFVFDTQGSGLDTTLSLLMDDCDGMELGCNEDIGDSAGFAALSMNMQAGEVVLAFVDGENVSGNFQLNIREQGYGDCFNDTEANACLSFESCVVDFEMDPTRAVCLELSDCNTPADCQAGAAVGGTAPVACANIFGNADRECYLDCEDGQQCPASMVCLGNGNGSLCMFN